MGLPLEQLSDTYVFPGYNNVTLNEQLRISNVDTVETTVTVKIGGTQAPTPSIRLDRRLALRGAHQLSEPGQRSGDRARARAE